MERRTSSIENEKLLTIILSNLCLKSRNSKSSRLEMRKKKYRQKKSIPKKKLICPKSNPNFRDISANQGTLDDIIATSQRQIAQNHTCLRYRHTTLWFSPVQSRPYGCRSHSRFFFWCSTATTHRLIGLRPRSQFLRTPTQMLLGTPRVKRP